MVHKKLSQVRLTDNMRRINLGKAVEAASRFTLKVEIPLNVTGDFYLGQVPYDCTFLGGRFSQTADEGTDGTLTIEKWDDWAGTTQTSISSALTIDAGGAGTEAISAVATGDEDIVASTAKIIVAKMAAVGNSIYGTIELDFGYVEYVNRRAA